jgi:hypothetical protein
MIGSSKSVWGFDPRSVPGCQLWLDAADSSTITFSSGSNVSVWTNKGIVSTTATPTRGATANQITYTTIDGYPGVYINNNSSVLYNSSTYSQLTIQSNFQNTADYSIFAVVNLSNVTNGELQTIYGNARGTSGETRTPNFGAGATLEFNSDNTNRMISSSFIGSGRLQTALISSSSALTAYTNATAYASITNGFTRVTTDTGALPIIGGSFGSSVSGGSDNRFANGYFHEILFYDSVLTTSQRQQVEGYLAHKWGLVPPSSTIPLSIPGCQLWLDAADATTIVQSSGNISQWNDKSTNALTATAVNNPTFVANLQNGLPGISLNGSNQYFNLGNNLNMGANQLYIFVVSKFNSTADGAIIGKSLYGGGVGRYSLVRLGSVLIPLAQGTGDGNNSGVISDTNTSVRLLSMIWDRNTIVLYQNGTSVFSVDLSDSSSATNNNSLLIGAYQNSSGGVPPQGFYMNGYIYEILLYLTPTSSPITTSQRQTIEQYLSRKWGIGSSSIPSTHPFYSIRPHLRTFQPIDVPGCQLWLDGADQSSMTLSGSSVTQWRDKSGIGATATRLTGDSYATLTTIQGNRILSFPGANAVYRSPMVLTGAAYTIFTISSLLSTSGNGSGYQRMINTDLTIFVGAVNGILGTFSGSGAWNDISTNTPSYTLLGTGLQLVTMVVSGSSLIPYINGTAMDAKTGTTGATTVLDIGGQQTNAQHWNGYIGDIIVYNSALTTSQRQQVEGYLAHKWGLSLSVPSPHPFKSFPPASLYFEPATKYSALFSDVNIQSLSIPSNAALSVGTNNHTIEFWFYQTSRDQYDTIFTYGSSPPEWTSRSNYFINIGTTQFSAYIGDGSGGFLIVNGGSLVTLNTWHHLALVRNGTTFTLYINGTSRSTLTSSMSIGPQIGSMTVGTWGLNGADRFRGYITNFRFVNGTAVYTSNFIPSTSPLTAIPNTQILLQGLTDRSANAFTVTSTGSVTLSTLSPFPPP